MEVLALEPSSWDFKFHIIHGDCSSHLVDGEKKGEREECMLPGASAYPISIFPFFFTSRTTNFILESNGPC